MIERLVWAVFRRVGRSRLKAQQEIFLLGQIRDADLARALTDEREVLRKRQSRRSCNVQRMLPKSPSYRLSALRRTSGLGNLRQN